MSNLNIQPRREEHPEFKVWSDVVRIRTEEHLQFIDLTELVQQRVRRSGLAHGLVNIQTRHTTTAIVVNENEPLLIQDIKDLLARWAPMEAGYRHDSLEERTVNRVPDERANGHSHARALVLGTSESLSVIDGEIHIGRWQRIFLVELDGARPREISVTVMGLTGAAGRQDRVLRPAEQLARLGAL